MKIINKLKRLFHVYFIKRVFVVTQMRSGVKYFYQGNGKWTPMVEGAKYFYKKSDVVHYKMFYNIEEYYL